MVYDGYQLSTHFNADELTVSASRPDLVEPIPEAYQPAATRLVTTCLQPLREWVGSAVEVLSGYRTPSLNAAIGGSPTSQHLRAEAADVTFPGLTAGFEVMMRGDVNVPVGQVIIYPPQNFIHIALPSARYPDPSFFLHDPSHNYHYRSLYSVDELLRLLDQRVG